MNGEQVTAVVDAAATTAEPVGQQPTTGDLYRAWVSAVGEWGDATEAERAARAKSDAARTKYVSLEQRLGAALLADVPRDSGRGRSGWVVVAGGLYHVDETGNEVDGWRYEIRLVPVRKVAV